MFCWKGRVSGASVLGSEERVSGPRQHGLCKPEGGKRRRGVCEHVKPSVKSQGRQPVIQAVHSGLHPRQGQALLQRCIAGTGSGCQRRQATLQQPHRSLACRQAGRPHMLLWATPSQALHT